MNIEIHIPSTPYLEKNTKRVGGTFAFILRSGANRPIILSVNNVKKKIQILTKTSILSQAHVSELTEKLTTSDCGIYLIQNKISYIVMLQNKI